MYTVQPNCTETVAYEAKMRLDSSAQWQRVCLERVVPKKHGRYTRNVPAAPSHGAEH